MASVYVDTNLTNVWEKSAENHLKRLKECSARQNRSYL